MPLSDFALNQILAGAVDDSTEAIVLSIGSESLLLDHLLYPGQVDF
jgi:hypothetical protein